MQGEQLLAVGMVAGLFGVFGLLYFLKRLTQNMPSLPGTVVASVDLVPGEWTTLSFEVQPAETTLWLEMHVDGDALPGYSSGAEVALRISAGERVLAEHAGFDINSHRSSASPFGGIKLDVSGGSSTYYRCTAELLKIDAAAGTHVQAKVRATPYKQLTPRTLRLFAAHFGKPRSA